jgi:ketosteroid isomerase-like protein
MSANLELIRRAYTAGTDVFLSMLAPDVEWTEPTGFPYAGTYRGPEEILRNVIARVAAEWEGFTADLENIYDAGDTIVVTGFYRGTYKATGKPIDASFAHVLTMEDGKIVRFVEYADSKQVWEAINQE